MMQGLVHVVPDAELLATGGTVLLDAVAKVELETGECFIAGRVPRV